jgi:hypothetical protein
MAHWGRWWGVGWPGSVWLVLGFRRQRSLQYLTDSQSRRHFFRHRNGRWQAKQIFSGSIDFRFGKADSPSFVSVPRRLSLSAGVAVGWCGCLLVCRGVKLRIAVRCRGGGGRLRLHPRRSLPGVGDGNPLSPTPSLPCLPLSPSAPSVPPCLNSYSRAGHPWAAGATGLATGARLRSPRWSM